MRSGLKTWNGANWSTRPTRPPSIFSYETAGGYPTTDRLARFSRLSLPIRRSPSSDPS